MVAPIGSTRPVPLIFVESRYGTVVSLDTIIVISGSYSLRYLYSEPKPRVPAGRPR